MDTHAEVRAHYDALIETGDDPFFDPPVLRAYMERWDGPPFWDAVGDLVGKRVLEVGIGTGRLAFIALNAGCAHLTGIDLSPHTIARAEINLIAYPNTELLVADITAFRRPRAFDVAYSVLTWMHVADKATALANLVRSLRPGGRLVLSLAEPQSELVFGVRRIRLYPTDIDATLAALADLGCRTEDPLPRLDASGERVATLVAATRET